MPTLIERLFALAPEIRYVATYLDGVHGSAQRPGIEGASSSESDKYEELIVNPTLLKLVTQRGNIDCGGADWVIIRYGHFYELVVPVPRGHLSIGIELSGHPLAIAEQVLAVAEQAL
ncbi:hypothetical protein [Geothrix terrae]|uniref:hypothetical protein n=1 Tax=Geothrix terrae TaxID=2922720 RepID=UPI001FADC6EF|nr:hypothetical protein [Geothrix terrae]